MTPNDHMKQAMTLEVRAKESLRTHNPEYAQAKATLAQMHATLALAKLQQLANRAIGMAG